MTIKAGNFESKNEYNSQDIFRQLIASYCLNEKLRQGTHEVCHISHKGIAQTTFGGVDDIENKK